MVGHTIIVKLVGFTVNKDHQQTHGGAWKEQNVNVRIVQEDESNKKWNELFGK